MLFKKLDVLIISNGWLDWDAMDPANQRNVARERNGVVIIITILLKSFTSKSVNGFGVCERHQYHHARPPTTIYIVVFGKSAEDDYRWW